MMSSAFGPPEVLFFKRLENKGNYTIDLYLKIIYSYYNVVYLKMRFCSEFYEYHALMMEEEGAVIVGLLVGLNVIDANLCVKGEDLDSQVRCCEIMF